MRENENDMELSELISSAKESIRNQNEASVSESSEAADTAKNGEAAKAAEEPPKKPSSPPDISFKNSPISNAAASRPVQTVQKEVPKREPTPPLPPKKPSGGNADTAGKRPSGANGAAKNTAKRPQGAKAKPNTGKKTASKPSGKRTSPKKPVSAEAVKKTFTKKQAATIGGLILALLLVLILIIYIIFSYYFDLLDRDKDIINNSEAMTYSDIDLSKPDTLNRQEEDERLKELLADGEKITNKDVMNLLLIGEDLRDTESGDAGNTDVMMIISVNTKDKTITLTSVMRDCYVTFQDANGWWYNGRINSAYWHGGVDLTQQTIENYLNVKIDRYVLVNFKTFIDIVDTIGGLDLTVTNEEANGYPGADPYGDNTRGMQNPLDEQNKYLGNKKGTDYIKKGGDLHLNGNQALAYARLRHVGNSDYDRTRRQRTVITEIIKKTRGLSLTEINDLALKVLPQLKTDITKKETLRLIADLLDYRNYELQEFRVPADGTFTEPTIDGMDVLSVDYETNAQMFREMVYGSVETDAEGNETDMTIE